MARSFNGTSDRIGADGAGVFNSTDGAVACSVSAWVKASAVVGHIYCDCVGSGFQTWAMLTSTSGFLNVQIRHNSNSTIALNATGTHTCCGDSAWHHVALTQDASRNVQAYVDGVLDINTSFTQNSGFGTSSQTRIGCRRNSGSEAFFLSGSAAGVATWTRHLSAGEVKTLAAGLPASHLGPTHYWPLWGVDSPEPDIGNG